MAPSSFYSNNLVSQFATLLCPSYHNPYSSRLCYAPSRVFSFTAWLLCRFLPAQQLMMSNLLARQIDATMRGTSGGTICDKYFERHVTGPDSVAYHCIICAGRSMKDYSRHMNSKTHQDNVARFKAQLFEQEDFPVESMPSSAELAPSRTNNRSRDIAEEFNDISTGLDNDIGRQKRARIASTDSSEDRAINNLINYNTDVDRILNSLPPSAALGSSSGSSLPLSHLFPASSSNMSTSGMSTTSLHNFNNIATMLSLDNEHLETARKVCSINGDENRYFATICYLSSIHQELNTVIQAKQATPVPASPAVAPAPKAWTASESFREWARHNLAKLITDHTLEAYSSTTDASKQPIPRSFEKLMMQLIKSQSKSFIEVHLPPGFGSEDPKPAEQVLKVVKDLAKHARSNFRSILLANILPENGKTSNSPIPTIKQIVGRIVRSHALKTEFRTDDEIEKTIQPGQKLRYAYLRMEAVHWHKCPDSNGRRSQWSAIDERLAMLGRKSYHYQETFYTLSMQRDSALFDGTRTYAQLSQLTSFDLPTDVEVQAAMVNMIPGLAPASVLSSVAMPSFINNADPSRRSEDINVAF